MRGANRNQPLPIAGRPLLLRMRRGHGSTLLLRKAARQQTAVRQLLGRMLESSSDDERDVAAAALEALHDREMLPALREAALRERDTVVGEQLCNAIAAIGGDTAAQALREIAARNVDWDMSASWVRQLADSTRRRPPVEGPDLKALRDHLEDQLDTAAYEELAYVAAETLDEVNKVLASDPAS